MPVYMMTSVATLYQVTAQDTHPIQRVGAPNIESSFNGMTQMALQNPTSRIQDRALAESAFKQQQKYLNDAAQVAVNIFNPTQTSELRFRATVKLTAVVGELQAFDQDSDSSGLAYALALALSWGKHKKLLSGQQETDVRVFATGCVPVDCYVKPVGHLLKKIIYACDYVESCLIAESSKNTITPKLFYILIPQANLDEVYSQSVIIERVNILGGKIVGISHVSEAMNLLMGDAFDGGIFTHVDNGFLGLQSISFEQRHLFMGREPLVRELYQKSLTAIEQGYILNVTGVSGSGKSSAVMAGLIPNLLLQAPAASDNKNDQTCFHNNWAMVRPSQYTSVQEILRELLSHISHDKPVVEQWLSQQQAPDKMAHSINEYLTQTSTDQLPKPHYLWVVDQYEEIFTHGSIQTNDAGQLFPILAVLAEQTPLLIITILRTEYLSALGGQASIDVQLPRRIPAQELERIIELQLQYHRLSTQSAQLDSNNPEHQQHLDHRIKNDAIGKPLTTISYLLQQMHQQMVQDNASETQLSHQHYDAVNGIKGVMAKQAELAIEAGLSNHEQNQHKLLINGFFEAFIGIDNDLNPVARALPNEELKHYPEGISDLTQAFMAKGLIIDCGKSHTPKIKLAHDTLLPIGAKQHDQPRWQRLLTWFDDHQNFLIWRQDIDIAFGKWLAAKHQPELTANNYLLDQASVLKTAHTLKVSTRSQNTQLRSYIEQSKTAYRRKKYTPWIIIATVLLLAGITVWDQFYRIKLSHTAFIGERYGIPFGVIPLDTSQRRLRQFHYRLTHQSGRLMSLSRHNSLGTLRNDISRDKAARWVYRYTAGGQLFAEDSFAQNGRKLTSKIFEFTPNGNIAQVRFKQHDSDNSIGDIAYQAATYEGKSQQKSQITQHQLVFNQKGYIEQRRFFNNNNQAVKDANGAYGLQYQYNQQGLITRLEYIGFDGKTIPLKGVYAREYTRDHKGKITAKSWLDKDGNLILNQSGYARTTTVYDSNGNLIQKNYLEKDTKLTTHKQGFARATAVYDQHGNQIEQLFLDANGKPTLHKSGFAKVVLRYDHRGNAIEWNYLDENNKPTLRDNHFSQVRFVYDQWGNKVEERYFGPDNQPTLHRNGYARFTANYDEQGNQLEEAYYDINNQLTLNKQGYARRTSVYDTKGQQIQRAYFGIHNEAVFNQYGYASYDAHYDDQGNRTAVDFKGLNGEPKLNHYGFARITNQYNNQGKKTQVAYYGINGEPILHQDGIAKINIGYDDAGNMSQVTYYDTQHQKILSRAGFAEVVMSYDKRGNRTQERYFDDRHQLIAQQHGYAQKTIRYDERNNPVEWQYFDLNNQLIVNTHGYARVIAQYDATDTIIGLAYFNASNQFISGKGVLKREPKVRAGL